MALGDEAEQADPLLVAEIVGDRRVGQLDRLEEIIPPKDWSSAWYSGARKVIRKEHQLTPKDGS